MHDVVSGASNAAVQTTSQSVGDMAEAVAARLAGVAEALLGRLG